MKTPSLRKYIDPKLILLLAGFYSLFDLIYVGKLAYFRANFPRGNEEPWADLIFKTILIDWLVVITYMTLIAISTKRLLNKNYAWEKIISIHTILSILIGLFIRVIFDIFGILSGYIDPANYEIQESVHRFMAVIDLNFLIYFAMVFIIYTYYYLKQVKESEKQQRILESQLASTRIKMLSSQLQPHFLFNTLNSISVLADLDPGKAKDTIADLSDFLREILYCNDTHEITLEKELRTLEYYLNILNVRFSDHLKIKKDIDESLLQHKVPALLLQPLIENAIKHGYSYDHTDLEITMVVWAEGDYLWIRVENNGKSVELKTPELLKKGVGLANIHDRLKNLYGTDFLFEVRNKDNAGGVETVLKIPR